MLSTSERKLMFQVFYIAVGIHKGTSENDSELIASRYFHSYGYEVLKCPNARPAILETGLLQQYKHSKDLFVAGVPDFFVYKIDSDQNKTDWFFVEVKKMNKTNGFGFTPNQIKWYLGVGENMPTALLIVEYLPINELKRSEIHDFKRLSPADRERYLALQEKLSTNNVGEFLKKKFKIPTAENVNTSIKER